nr:DUF2809 domain-containing protein [Auraticoccus cholistanensis]
MAGGVLYACAWVLLVALLVPAARPATCAVAAATVGVLLELLQLTGVPARLSEQVPALRLLLGSTFSGWDLLWCLLGSVLGGLLLALLPRPAGAVAAVRDGGTSGPGSGPGPH